MNESSSSPVSEKIVAIVKQLLIESGITHQHIIRPDESLRHLGIDSLGRAELFRRVESAFNVTLPDKMLMEVNKLSDIAAYVQKATPWSAVKPSRQIITAHGDRPNLDPSATESLIDVLFLYGEQAPDKAHIYFQAEEGGQEVITYGELLKASLQVAYSMQQRGIKAGDTVAIMQPTHPGFFYTFLGTMLAGAIPVPIYPPFRMHMLEAYAQTEARILSNAEVRMLVTFEKAETLSRLLQGFVPSLKQVVTVNELLQPEQAASPSRPKQENYAFIQYTSGSTSDPKGVLLSHYNLLSNIRAYGKAIKVTPEDVVVSWLPLYHDMGLIGMWLGSLYHGTPLVLMTPFSFLNRPERWLWAIHHYRGTLSGAPNFAYELCARKIEPALIEGLDLSSWRMAANGAEKVYPRTLEQFAKKFAPYGFKRTTLFPVYGLAESAVALVLPPIGREFKVDYVDRKQFELEKYARPAHTQHELAFVSCGSPLEGHEVRICDDDNHELPERQVGSLQFRGPSSMQGYYNNPRATKAVCHDGWINSGDLAYKADGEIYVTGRRKDVIIKAGRNLYPAEIEELVGAIKGVRQGCVTAFSVADHEQGTEQLVVVAETREKKPAAREEMIAQINEALANTLDIVPDKIVLASSHAVPKTSSGKLQRAATKNLYLEGKLERFQAPAWLQVVKLGWKWGWRKIAAAFNRIFKLAYTTYAAIVILLLLLPVYISIAFASPQRAIKICKCAARWLLRLLCCPLTVNEESNLYTTSPVIFIANHASYIDAVVVLAVMPENTCLVGKKELFETPIVRTFMHKLGFLAVDRENISKGMDDTKEMAAAIKAGRSVFIFPEGTFGYAVGLRPFKLGAFKIATESDTPICSVALRGTRYILRDNEKLMSPGPIAVTICPPIKAKGKEWEDIIALRQAARAEIARSCGEPSLDFIVAQTVAPSYKNESE